MTAPLPRPLQVPLPRRRRGALANAARVMAAAALATSAVLAVAEGLAPPAGAHEGPGILTVETDEPTPTGHHYVVRLVWENDGHPAARDTTITATPFAPDGAPQTPVPMTAVDDDGRFEATVEMGQPGAWRVQFTSVSPVATVDQPVEVAAPTTSSTTATTTTTAETGSGSAGGTGADNDETAADPTASTETDDDSSGGVVVVLVVAALVAAGVAIAGWFVLRRRGPAPSTEAPSDSAPDSDAGTAADAADAPDAPDSTTKIES